MTFKKSTCNNCQYFLFVGSTRSPDLSVFPFKNFYKINDPENGRVTTPMSVRTDKCERLWLLDAAVQNISGNQLKANPGIYVFNAKTGQLIRSFNIPPTQWSKNSFFVNFVIDSDVHCEETYGYFADFNRFHLLVYDFRRNRSELKSHPFFSPDPLIHTSNDVLLNPMHQDNNGIYGLALAHYDTPNERDKLYFHPLAGTYEFSVETDLIKSSGDLKYHDVEVWKNKGAFTQSGTSAFDPQTKTLFFAELHTRKIGIVQLKNLNDTKMNMYHKYDFNLRSGVIVDLKVHMSELWVLVDDNSEIIMHKLSIPVLNMHSSANSNLFKFVFSNVALLFVIHFFLL